MERKVLGDFTILKKLGQGTLGATFLAEHRFMKRHYVLKILGSEFTSDSKFLPRFEKEMAVIASFSHENVVPIHSVSFADGQYFLVCDYITDPNGEHHHLGEYLKEGKKSFSEEEIASFLTQIASTLDAAHEKKSQGFPLAHRSLKLSNILIGSHQGRIKPMIADFGLASCVGEAAILTKLYKHLSEAVYGSTFQESYDDRAFGQAKAFHQVYAFLSPEQRVGKETPSCQSDVYAFGVLTYFMLTRSFPEGFFPLPSELRGDLKFSWDEMIMQLLAPNPQKRPQHIEPLMHALQLSVQQRAPAQEVKRNGKTGYEQVELFTKLSGADAVQIRTEEKLNPVIRSHFEGVKSEFVRQETASVELLEEPEAPHKPQEMLEGVSDLVRKSQEPHKPQPLLRPQEVARPMYDPDPAKALHVDSTVSAYRPNPSKAVEIEPILTDMVIVRGGEYFIGSDDGARDERPRHPVFLNDFAMDIHPVTNEQFVRFLEVMGGEKDVNNQDIIRLRESRIKKFNGKFVIESGYSKHPVVGVTWYGADAYAKWVGKRLPTEAEYEVAIRGGSSDTLYPTGVDIDRAQANFFSSDTTPIMSYPPNGLGLYDIVGNVYHWCNDWYGYTYYEESIQEPENPRGPVQGVYRVLRGGCWKSLKDDLRCSHRHRNNPATINKTYGFRCAADVGV